MTTRRAVKAVIALSLVTLGLSCSRDNVSNTGATSDTSSETTPTATADDAAATDVTVVDLPDIVVTYSVLGAFVEQLAGDVADIVVLIPDGQDPHDFEPSPRDIEIINNATLVVANGLDLEEGLDDALATAASNGTTVFYVADHVTVLEIVDVNDHSAHGHDHPGAQTDHSHDDHDHTEDPHVWLSPTTMLEALPALTTAVGNALNVDLMMASEAFAGELAAVDTELGELFDALPNCQLVTGHNELGYFATRYGCTVIAAILSSPSTSAEESASNVEFVIDVIKTHNVQAVFTSLGTNPAVARQVADEVGVPLVEISTHYLGTTNSYIKFIRQLGTTIATSLK